LEGRGYPIMMSTENTPIRGAGKNGKAESKAKKAAKRSRKPAQQGSPAPEQVEQVQEPITGTAVAMDMPPADPTPDAPATPVAAEPSEPALVEHVETAPVEHVETALMEHVETAPFQHVDTVPLEHVETAPVARVDTAPVSLQTITNAYGDFTRKSIEQTSAFFEQLAGVRSLSQACELQGEFARQTYETFVSESRKIRELHSELTMQRLRHLEGFVAKMKPPRFP
jgi:hypothetical protein